MRKNWLPLVPGPGVGHRERAARIDHRSLQRRIGRAGIDWSGTRWRTGSPVRQCPYPTDRRTAARRSCASGGQPVTRRVVEEPLLGQAGEAVDGARRLAVVELQADVAPVGGRTGADRGRTGRHFAGPRRLGGLAGRLVGGRVRRSWPPRVGGGSNVGKWQTRTPGEAVTSGYCRRPARSARCGPVSAPRRHAITAMIVPIVIR